MSDLYCGGCGVPSGTAHFPYCPYRHSTASPMVSGEQLRAKKTYANYPPKYELQCAACAIKDTEIERLQQRIDEFEEYKERYPPDFIEKLQQKIDELRIEVRRTRRYGMHGEPYDG